MLRQNKVKINSKHLLGLIGHRSDPEVKEQRPSPGEPTDPNGGNV